MAQLHDAWGRTGALGIPWRYRLELSSDGWWDRLMLAQRLTWGAVPNWKICFPAAKINGNSFLPPFLLPLVLLMKRWVRIIVIHQYAPSVRKTDKAEIFVLGWVPNLIFNDFFLEVCWYTLHLHIQFAFSNFQIRYRKYNWSKFGCRNSTAILLEPVCGFPNLY